MGRDGGVEREGWRGKGEEIGRKGVREEREGEGDNNVGRGRQKECSGVTKLKDRVAAGTWQRQIQISG